MARTRKRREISSSTLISFGCAEQGPSSTTANQEARDPAIFVSISPGSLTMRNEDAHGLGLWEGKKEAGPIKSDLTLVGSTLSSRPAAPIFSLSLFYLHNPTLWCPQWAVGPQPMPNPFLSLTNYMLRPHLHTAVKGIIISSSLPIGRWGCFIFRPPFLLFYLEKKKQFQLLLHWIETGAGFWISLAHYMAVRADKTDDTMREKTADGYRSRRSLSLSLILLSGDLFVLILIARDLRRSRASLLIYFISRATRVI